MKSQIMHIGVLDKLGMVHSVSFDEGVNIITGRSSTGKSALIEIFDYCFGSSDFTVPVGVITDCADYYFTVIKIKDSAVVLARRQSESKIFLMEVLDFEEISDVKKINVSYFQTHYFYPKDDFLNELKRYFGVLVTDVDLDPEAKKYTGRKLPTPSARSFTSYMLQHQNLVANKHAVFYRFDQKQKHDQAIDHLKIFLGLADQEYFIYSQKRHAKEQELRTLERSLPKKEAIKKAIKGRLSTAIDRYKAISGVDLKIDIDDAISNPKRTLQAFRSYKVELSDGSKESIKIKRELEKKHQDLRVLFRRKEQELDAIQYSITYSEMYDESNQDIPFTENTDNLQPFICPFCKSSSVSLQGHANELTEAVNWLNSELARSSLRLSSFKEEEKIIKEDLSGFKADLRVCRSNIKAAKEQRTDFEDVASQYELAVEAKVGIQAILADLAIDNNQDKDVDLEGLRSEIHRLKEFLKGSDVKLKIAENRINEILKIYGERFEFEKSYTPINLRFSIETFDLWHEPAKNEKVFLRSMGSGANWLSCHLVLFLSLQRYFCELGNDCSIPSILFFDQPSQVYFPSLLDGETKFSAEDIARKDNSRNKSRTVDEDVRAVTNLFDQLVKYCAETKEITGICPQIIVTDHADHLKLKGDAPFESFVRKRWREEGEGFINILPTTPEFEN